MQPEQAKVSFFLGVELGMARSGRSHFIDSFGPVDASLEAGLKWLVGAASESGGKGIIAVSTKQILLNLHWSKYGDVFARLHKDGYYKVKHVSLVLYTPRSPLLHAFDGPILVIHGGQTLLDAIDAFHGKADVLYIPFVKGDHQDWAATWGATPIGEDDHPPKEVEEPTSGVTLLALQALTDQINIGTGITHPNDYESTVRTLETLHHKGAGLSPEDVRRQLIRLGWDPKDAKEVKDLAEKITAGRRPKATQGKADEHLWSYWQSQLK